MSFFAAVFFLLFYSFFTLFGNGGIGTTLYGSFYFTTVISVFIGISTLLGGISVTKSDQEFLLVSAVRKRDLVPALYIAQFLASGLILLAAALITVLQTYRVSPLLGIALFNIGLLSLYPVSIGIALSGRSLPVRIATAAVSLAWVLSGLIGFRYSAISFLRIDPLYSLITIAPVTVLSFLAAARVLSGENVPYRAAGLSRQGRDYANTSSYLGLSPRMAIIKMGVTQISLATRSSSMGNIRPTARRIRVTIFLYVMIALAIAYAIVSLKFYNLAASGFKSSGVNIISLLFAVYVGSTPQMMLSSGAMAYERAWLSFTSMEEWRYINTLILSKIVQALIAAIPFSAANLLLYFLEVPGTLPSIFIFELLGPVVVCAYLFMAFSIRPYQMKDENYIPARFSAVQFIIALPLMLFYGSAFVVMFFPPAMLVVGPLMLLIVLLLVTRRSYWKKRVNKIVEGGFV